ncbi:MAG: hypothetical protein OXH68_15865 [Gammaproteobacteria bacterium]|nr:hypothetical protein [Gammaproteobacteria bacterium]
MATTRKPFLLRTDPEVVAALQRWAADELRSVNAQIDFLLRRALRDAGRFPDRLDGGAGGTPATDSDKAAGSRSGG